MEEEPNITGPPYMSWPLSLGVTTSLATRLLVPGVPEARRSLCPGEPLKEDCSRPWCKGEPKGKGEKGWGVLGAPRPRPPLSSAIAPSHPHAPAIPRCSGGQRLSLKEG